MGRVLGALETERKVSASAAAAFRLLMLTGCRRNEVLTLRWEDVDLDAGELRMRDAKTGGRSVALSPAATKVLATMPRLQDNPWVIAGPRPGRRLSSLNGRWLVVRARAGLEDVRIHDLRHSFASRALALGESLRMRKAPRSPEGADDRPLHPPCAGVGEDVRRQGLGEYSGRYGSDLSCSVEKLL